MEEKRGKIVIDFQKVKEDRQHYLNNSLLELYEAFFSYIEMEANIREKVRAKQIFSHKTKIGKELLDDRKIAAHFEHWFAFDYVTVIGSRLFDIFIREKKNFLSKAMLDISGFFMLMYLEPVEIADVTKSKLAFRRILSNKGIIHEGESFLFSPTAQVGDIALIRTIKLGINEKVIGPSININGECSHEVLDELMRIKDLGDYASRKYLKENGIDYLRYQKGEE